MGLFNEILIEDGTPVTVQFKYGMRWQYQYRIGDRITWDHLDRPIEATGEVVVPGVGARGSDNRDRHYAIVIVDDVIRSVDEISECEYEQLMKRRVDKAE